jgi:CBS domain-containing membrane protein
MQDLLVSDLMTDHVLSIRPNEDLARLVELMDDIHVRHVPVVDEGNVLVGVVSQRDLIRHVLHAESDLPLAEMRQLLEARDVRSVMVTDVESVEPMTPISEAGQIMFDNKLGCLPVVQADCLVGILTEADFVKYVIRHPARA